MTPSKEQIKAAKATYPSEFKEWEDCSSALEKVNAALEKDDKNQSLKEQKATLEGAVAMIEILLGFREIDKDDDVMKALKDLFK